MSRYSYERCLRNAYRVNWRIEDVIDGREFDSGREWLPRGLSGASGVAFLNDDERRKLTHVEMAAYTHLFGYVEEFIAPTIVEQAQDFEAGDRSAFDALINFASEEIKHMNLFRQVRDRINETMGFHLERLGGARETANFVRSKSTASVLLLTACIEWLTQRHYLECFQDDENLDPFTSHIFKSHWQEECQHAQMDHLETLRVFKDLTSEERDQAIDELIELVGAVDSLLQEQSRFDVDNFLRYIGRDLSAEESEQVHEHILSAKRHTFLATGVTHPRFLELFAEVATPAQQDRVNHALVTLLPTLETT